MPKRWIQAGCMLMVSLAAVCAAPGETKPFKMLFMYGDDVEDTWGNLKFVSNPLHVLHKMTGTNMDHVYTAAQEPDGSWTAYGMCVAGGDDHKPHPSSSYRLCKARTIDGYHFTQSVVQPWEGPGPNLFGDHGMLQQSFTYNARTRQVLLLYYEKHNPDGHGFALNAFTSKDGLKYTPVPGNPIYGSLDALHAMWDPRSGDYFCYQICFQPWKKKYPDNAQQGRRVITIRRSHDGTTWKPDWRHWTVDARFDPEALFAPDQNDPEDLEFYWFSPFPYADRYIGIISLYEPCAPEVNPRNPNKPNAHGPYLGYEWVISKDAVHWSRPYQNQFVALEPGDTSSMNEGVFLAPAGSPIIANGEILWDGAKGVKEDRIGCVATAPNAEFSSHKFTMPAAGLLLNATARWFGEKEAVFLQRQAYIMVELRDGGGRVIPGYERSKCVLGDVDSPDLPLVWAGHNATELAGKTVQLRFYFRNARIYAVHTK